MAGRPSAGERWRTGCLRDAVALAHQAAKARGAAVTLDLGRDATLESLDSPQESFRLAGGGVSLARHSPPAPLPPQPCLQEDRGEESG